MSLALLRIEFKLDLILHTLKERDPVLRGLIGDADVFAKYGEDLCPVCESPIVLTLDPAGETIQRDCGCRPPFQVVKGISALTSPSPAKTAEVLHLQPLADVAEDDPDPTALSTTSSQKGAP